MKEYVDRTFLTVKDLSEQPESKYVLAIGQVGAKNYYAVDGFTVADGLVIFNSKAHGDDPTQTVMMAFPVESLPWSIHHRSVVELPTIGTYLRQKVKDGDAHMDLAKELGVVVDAGPATEGDEDQPVIAIKRSPGQYL